MKLRIIVLLLCAAMLVGSLSGCAGSELRNFSGTGDSQEDTEQTGDITSDTSVPRDYSEIYAAYSADELVMTINELPVYWNEYFYWLRTAIDNYEYNKGAITDWDVQNAFGVTEDSVADYIKNYALDILTQYRALESNAKDLGAELTAEDQVNLAAIWTEDAAAYGNGDEQAFLDYMDALYLSKDLYDYINEVSCLYYNAFNIVYGPTGELCSQEDALSFAAENGYMMAKHILISTVDAEGEALPEEAIAEKKALAEDVASQLKAVSGTEEMTVLFDKLMDQHSEDPGMAYYPDGYCFTSGKMVQEFEDTALALGDYEVSGIVETSYGYHIILKLPLSADAVVEYYSEDEQYTLRYVAAVSMYDSLVTSWMDEAKVESGEEFKSLDISKLF